MTLVFVLFLWWWWWREWAWPQGAAPLQYQLLTVSRLPVIRTTTRRLCCPPELSVSEWNPQRRRLWRASTLQSPASLGLIFANTHVCLHPAVFHLSSPHKHGVTSFSTNSATSPTSRSVQLTKHEAAKSPKHKRNHTHQWPVLKIFLLINTFSIKCLFSLLRVQSKVTSCCFSSPTVQNTKGLRLLSRQTEKIIKDPHVGGLNLPNLA